MIHIMLLHYSIIVYTLNISIDKFVDKIMTKLSIQKMFVIILCPDLFALNLKYHNNVAKEITPMNLQRIFRSGPRRFVFRGWLLTQSLGVLTGCLQPTPSETVSWNQSPSQWLGKEDERPNATVTIDVAGQSGEDGRKGNSGLDDYDGDDGEDGTDGTDGGTIDIRLSYSTLGVVAVSGSGQRADGSTVSLSQKIAAQRNPLIWLKASGGQGGSGGEGGEGGEGSDGSDGMDATSYSQGSNGSNGKDGGDGGDGGNGGNGGHGGKITVSLSEDDTELLWLVKKEVFGGPGGQGGRGGDGGDGGRGGDGGSSYTSFDSGTNTIKTVSGGYSGSSGGDGYSGRRGDDGVHGDAGIATINVRHRSGDVESFQRAFEFSVPKIQYREEFLDGVLEPGESFAISGLTVKNTGEMPTPKKPATLIMSCIEQASVLTLGLPSPLLPAGEKVFTFPSGHHAFKVSGLGLSNDEANCTATAKIGDLIHSIGMIKSLPIGMPVNIESVREQDLYVQQGTTGTVVIPIVNNSIISYGEGALSKRRLVLKISASPKNQVFSSSAINVQHGSDIATMETAMEIPVDQIEAKGRWDVPLVFEFQKQVPLGAVAQIKAELFLEPIHKQSHLLKIGESSFTLTHTLNNHFSLANKLHVDGLNVVCDYESGRKTRKIDELFISKKVGDNTVSIQYDFDFWFWRFNDSPVYQVPTTELNDVYRILDPSGNFDASDLVKLFQKVLIPKSWDSGPKEWKIERCYLGNT